MIKQSIWREPIYYASTLLSTLDQKSAYHAA